MVRDSVNLLNLKFSNNNNNQLESLKRMISEFRILRWYLTLVRRRKKMTSQMLSGSQVCQEVVEIVHLITKIWEGKILTSIILLVLT